jgi:hypothetical protein
MSLWNHHLNFRDSNVSSSINFVEVKEVRERFQHEVPHLYREAFDALLEAALKDGHGPRTWKPASQPLYVTLTSTSRRPVVPAATTCVSASYPRWRPPSSRSWTHDQRCLWSHHDRPGCHPRR